MLVREQQTFIVGPRESAKYDHEANYPRASDWATTHVININLEVTGLELSQSAVHSVMRSCIVRFAEDWASCERGEDGVEG